jgi:hypothetical protein
MLHSGIPLADSLKNIFAIKKNMKQKTIKKIIIVVIIIGLIAAFKFFDLGQYLSFSYLK